MPRLHILLSVCLTGNYPLLGVEAQAQGVNKYVDLADLELATAAKVNADTYCAKRETLEIPDRTSARAELERASGDNIILDSMREANSQSELSSLFARKATGPAMFALGAPLVVCIVFAAIYILFCCWSALPCCRIYRCCAKRREIPMIAKLVFFGILAVLMVALVVMAGVSTGGYTMAVQGFEVTSCASAKMVSSTLSGQTSPHFLGLIPTLNIFDRLYSSLDENSKFISDLKAILTDTSRITSAVNRVKGQLELLQGMMADPANKDPAGTLHTCQGCVVLAEALAPAVATIDSSLGAALSSARTEVDKQLSGEALKSLQSSMDTAGAPLSQLKATISGAFSPLVKDKLAPTVVDQMNVLSPIASTFMILFALLISAFGVITVLLWLFREKSGSGEYNQSTHRCAACTWCCGCCYIIFAFLLGGILMIVAFPFAGVCIIMEDVSSQMLKDIAPAIGTDMTADGSDMMLTFVDECFRNPDKTANPRMLELLKVDSGNGTQITIYDQLVTQSREQIDVQFQKISSMTDGSSIPSVKDDPNIKALTTTLKENPIDTMIVTSESIQNDPSYQDMAKDTRGTDKVAEYLISSAACDDATIPSSQGGQQQSLKGISNFSNSLSGLGTQRLSATCAREVICSATTLTPRGQACASANQFMALKQKLRTEPLFQCRSFTSGSGRCDVLSGSSCLKQDGTPMDVETYACTLPEFTVLVQQFEQRFNVVLNDLQADTEGVFDEIQVRLRALLDTNFLNPVAEVGNGVTCGFLGQAYQNILDGMCYGGALGIRSTATAYVDCASIMLFVVIIMYIVWRLTLDNVASSKQIDGEQTSVLPQERVIE